MKIRIAIQGKEIDLAPKEARAIFDDLSKVFNVNYGAPVHYPVLSPVQYEYPNPWTVPSTTICNSSIVDCIGANAK